MSKYHYRNISFSAYIEYDFLDCTGTFAENVLRICSHFMLIFLCPCCLCSRSLCTSLCGGEICTFLVHKVKRNRSIWGPCQFFLSPNTLWKCYLSICLEAWKNLHGKNIWKSEEIVWNMWRIFQEKWKTIWTNDEFDWKSERLYMTKIWKSEEFVWKHEG